MLKVFKFLHSRKITPNSYCLLVMKKSKLELANFLNSYTEYVSLEGEGYVERVSTDPSSDDHFSFRITQKGLDLIEEVNEKFNKVEKKRLDSYEDWLPHIEKYRTMFPTGKQGSKPIRSNTRELYERFVWFFENHPTYTWEEVLKATKKYIDYVTATADRARFMKTSSYFIWKQRDDKSKESRLADWCDLVRDGEEPSSEDSTKFFTLL